uniref:WH1 domain-containing protein n=1 Tax=Taeniopygia guttata TaxID=59729 RepID=A0A674HH15_TAEGU
GATGDEQLLCSSRAAVLLYDEVQRQWQPPQVGTRASKPPQVVLDCALGRGLRYSQTTPQFHQWRQGRRVWGLSFAAPPEAARFAGAVLRALRGGDGRVGAARDGHRWGGWGFNPDPPPK